MVVDPHLARHLAHWGINMMQAGGRRPRGGGRGAGTHG